MNKGKINKEINIEEMLIEFPNFGDLLTEMIRRQNEPPKKRKSNKKKED
jgi:hypothetical protein